MVNSTDPDPLTRYPLTLHLGDASFALRLIAPNDRDAIVDLARRQPPEDLLYLRRDLTQPEVVEEWLARAAAGQIVVLVAQSGTGVVAYAGIDRGDVSWTSHVRELRILVDAEERCHGLGRAMVREALSLAYAMGAHKVVAQMPDVQTGARKLFEDFGFDREAVLQRHVRDRSGAKHDLIVMSLEATDI